MILARARGIVLHHRRIDGVRCIYTPDVRAEVEVSYHVRGATEPRATAADLLLESYPRILYIETLSIRNDLQGQGIGSAILRAILRATSRWHVDAVGLMAQAPKYKRQDDLVRFYMRHGFRLHPGTSAIFSLTSKPARLTCRACHA